MKLSKEGGQILYEVVVAVKSTSRTQSQMFARFLGLVKIPGKATSVDRHPDTPERHWCPTDVPYPPTPMVLDNSPPRNRDTGSSSALKGNDGSDGGSAGGNNDERIDREQIAKRRERRA